MVTVYFLILCFVLIVLQTIEGRNLFFTFYITQIDNWMALAAKSLLRMS